MYHALTAMQCISKGMDNTLNHKSVAVARSRRNTPGRVRGLECLLSNFWESADRYIFQTVLLLNCFREDVNGRTQNWPMRLVKRTVRRDRSLLCVKVLGGDISFEVLRNEQLTSCRERATVSSARARTYGDGSYTALCVA